MDDSGPFFRWFLVIDYIFGLIIAPFFTPRMDLLFESTKNYGSQLQNTIVDNEHQMQDRMLRDDHAITSGVTTSMPNNIKNTFTFIPFSAYFTFIPFSA